MPYTPVFNQLLSLAIKQAVDNKELTPQFIFDNYLKRLGHNQHDEFINKLRSEFLKIMRSEDADKKINNVYYGQIKLLAEKHYQQIYYTLISLAKWKPLNHINAQSAKIECPITLVDIQAENVITVSTGHRYDIDALIHCPPGKNPMGGEFSHRDQYRILRTKQGPMGFSILPLIKAVGKNLLLGGGVLFGLLTVAYVTFILLTAALAWPLALTCMVGVCLGTAIIVNKFCDSISETAKQYKELITLKSDQTEPDEADVIVNDTIKIEKPRLEPYHASSSNAFFSDYPRVRAVTQAIGDNSAEDGFCPLKKLN